MTRSQLCHGKKESKERFSSRKFGNYFHLSSYSLTGPAENVKIQVLFIVGQNQDKYIRGFVSQEANMYGDVMEGNFPDSFYSQTHKTHLALRIFVQKYTKAKYFVKTTDNSPLDISILLELLRKQTSKDFVLGRVRKRVNVIHDTCNALLQLSLRQFEDDVLPDYTTGPAYVLSALAARNILRSCPEIIQIVHLEDIYVTGICRKRAGVALKHTLKMCQQADGSSSKTVVKQQCIDYK